MFDGPRHVPPALLGLATCNAGHGAFTHVRFTFTLPTKHSRVSRAAVRKQLAGRWQRLAAMGGILE